MFRTKSDVDRYASKILNQSKTPQKKSSEGLRIAKLYFEIKEYDCAQNYLASFLSENPNDPLGWKLMGEVHENSDKDWSKCIDCYAKYYEFDSQACPILLKICSCYKNLDRNFDKAIKWIELTEKVYPYAKQVIELKERIWSLKQKHLSVDWEGYLKRAIVDNPDDEELKLKLVHCLIEQEKHAAAVEFVLKNDIDAFNMMSFAWYDSIMPLLKTALVKTESQSTHLVYLLVLSRMFFLSIEDKNFQEAGDVLKKIDCSIKCYESNEKYEENYKIELLNEIKSQFYFQCGLLAIKGSDRKEDLNLCNICFIISSFKSKPNQFKRLAKSGVAIDDFLNDYVHLTSCFRYTIIGHWLKKESIGDQLSFIDDIKRYCANNEVKKLVLERIYGSDSCSQNGFFHNTTGFEIPESEYLFVDLLTLDYSDKVCLSKQGYNLKLIIWYSLIQLYKYNTDLPRLYIPNYGSIPFGVENLNYTVWESVSTLDLEVFLYATLIQCCSFNNIQSSQNATLIRPFWLQSHLCTKEQSNWWFHCIKQLEVRNEIEKTMNSKTTQTLNNGIEIIRLKKACSKQMNFQVSMKLAIYLQNRVNSIQEAEKVDACSNNGLDTPKQTAFYAKADYDILPLNEKFKFLNLYATQYWCYIANYIKIANNFGNAADESMLNDSFSKRDASKLQKSFFFDVLNNFAELFDNDQYNFNIYQLALMYMANKKISENDYLNVYEIVKELKFDQQKFNDKIEYKLAKYFKNLSEKILLNRATEAENDDYKRLVELIKKKLLLALEFIDNFKAESVKINAATSPIVRLTPKKRNQLNEQEVKPKTVPSIEEKNEPVVDIMSPEVVERRPFLDISPVKVKSPQQRERDEKGDSLNQTNKSLYKSMDASNLNQSENDTLYTAKSTQSSSMTSFEMSKNSESSLLLQEESIEVTKPLPPLLQPETVQQESTIINSEHLEPRMDMQEIIDRLQESKSVKINLYRDILDNQFSTMSKQRNQIKEEMKELHNAVEKLHTAYLPQQQSHH